MTIHRTDFSFINEAWYEFTQSSISDAEIPDMCVYYTADHADTHADIMAHADYVRYGQQFYVDSNPTGLYAGRSTLKKFSVDAVATTWEHKFRVATTQPDKIGRDPNPLSRGVEFIERASGFRKVSSLIDFYNQPVVNRAGDRIAGFEVELPAPSYRYGGNFATIPNWALDLDGCVNDADLTLPIRKRAPDGTLTTVQNITVPAGHGKLIITQLPFVPTEENNVSYFPINWEWQVSPVGWNEPILNEGFQEKVYLDASGDVVDSADIAAGNYEKVIKRQILDEEGEPVREKVLLDYYGRKLAVPVLSDESQGTVNLTNGSSLISSGTATFAEEWRGLLCKITNGSSINQWSHITMIKEVILPSTIHLADPAPFTAAGADIYLPGISALSFAAVPYVDMSVVPV